MAANCYTIQDEPKNYIEQTFFLARTGARELNKDPLDPDIRVVARLILGSDEGKYKAVQGKH